jgi:hypothetical protein
MLFLSLVGTVVGARVGYAKIGDGTLYAGRELEGLTDVLGSTKTVFVNGTPVNISTAFTDQSPTAVLDRFQEICVAHPQFMVRALNDVPAAMREKPELGLADRLLALGIVRKEVKDEGALVCFTDERPSSLHDLPERVRAFRETGDLAAFGHLRYVYAHRSGSSTHVRTAWTEGSIALRNMFPAEGDAAGFDSELSPRPPSARRLLTGTSAQVPFAVHIYRSSEPKDDVRAFYDREMTSRGWQRAGGATANTVVYVKNGTTMVYVTLLPQSGGGTLVTTTDTARTDAPSIAAIHVER